MKAELVPENGDPPIPIERDLTVVGRHENCDVVITDASLSKRHCVLVKTDGLLVIRDLATTNGTKVKGQRIRWAAPLPEDKVSLGGYKIRIYLGSDEMPTPSEQRQGRSRSPGRAAPLRAAAASLLTPGFPGPSPDPDANPEPTEPPSSDRNGQKPALVASHQDRAAVRRSRSLTSRASRSSRTARTRSSSSNESQPARAADSPWLAAGSAPTRIAFLRVKCAGTRRIAVRGTGQRRAGWCRATSSGYVGS